MDGQVRASERAAEETARAGLNATSLAERADVDAGTVRDFLAGKRWPRTTTRNKIEEALGLRRGLFELIARGAYLDDESEDEVERAIKASPLSRANQHKLIGVYFDMLEQQEQRGA